MHSTAYRSLDTRRATRDLEACIVDGQAWIVSSGRTGSLAGSGSGHRRTADRVAGEPPVASPTWASSPGALAALAARRRRRTGADLFFQGTAAQQRGPSTAAAAPIVPATRRCAGVAALGAFAILPFLLFARPEQPVAAPIGTTKSTIAFHSAQPGKLVIADLKTGMTKRGGGDVLVLDGTVRNTSSTSEVLPAILVTLASDAGPRLSKPLALKSSSLAPGQSIHFHSTVAVASGTTSDVLVAFMPSGTQESPSQ